MENDAVPINDPVLQRRLAEEEWLVLAVGAGEDHVPAYLRCQDGTVPVHRLSPSTGQGTPLYLLYHRGRLVDRLSGTASLAALAAMVCSRLAAWAGKGGG